MLLLLLLLVLNFSFFFFFLIKISAEVLSRSIILIPIQDKMCGPHHHQTIRSRHVAHWCQFWHHHLCAVPDLFRFDVDFISNGVVLNRIIFIIESFVNFSFKKFTCGKLNLKYHAHPS